jgi:hypothetical protein
LAARPQHHPAPAVRLWDRDRLLQHDHLSEAEQGRVAHRAPFFPEAGNIVTQLTPEVDPKLLLDGLREGREEKRFRDLGGSDDRTTRSLQEHHIARADRVEGSHSRPREPRLDGLRPIEDVSEEGLGAHRDVNAWSAVRVGHDGAVQSRGGLKLGSDHLDTLLKPADQAHTGGVVPRPRVSHQGRRLSGVGSATVEAHVHDGSTPLFG